MNHDIHSLYMYDVTFMCMVMKDDNKPVIAL